MRPVSFQMINSLFYETKMTGVKKILKFKRHMSKLDVFLWLTVRCYSEVCRRPLTAFAGELHH